MKQPIPKIIHYCWFGGNPLPPLAQKCIASWKKHLPEYEIKEWNESNFDVNAIPYIREAYAARKYAFVSDYARFVILYEHGGLYFDTDVEIIRPLDDIIERGAFMGCETDGDAGTVTVAPGLGLGTPAGSPLYKELLNLYAGLHFVDNQGKQNLKTVVEYTTEILRSHGLKDVAGIQQIAETFIYPTAYFCPVSVTDGKLRIVPETRTIHHYAQSWQSPWRKYGRKLVLTLCGKKAKNRLKHWLHMK